MPNEYQLAIAEIRRAQKRIITAKKTLDKSDAVLTKSALLLKEKGIRPYHKKNALPENVMPTAAISNFIKGSSYAKRSARRRQRQ